jgi:hypothetical protein
MKKMILFALGAGASLLAVSVVVGPHVIASADASEMIEPARRAFPTESPSFDEDCYEWKYPKKDQCGALSGTTECKAEPSINSAADDEKREQCAPTKGDLCLCD